MTMADSFLSSSMVVLVLVTLTGLQSVSGASFSELVRSAPPRTCAELGYCCQGQNNTCFVFGPRMDRSPDSRRCYCDSNCLIMGDCCTDYHHTCRGQDCQVAEWQDWSECDNGCGYGTRKRIRQVVVYPDNGGKPCPPLKQRRACVGYIQEVCRQNMLEQNEEEMNERARILPFEFGRARDDKEFDPWSGILKNLYQSRNFNKIPTKATYRSKFRIIKSHYGCEDSEWTSVLKANTTVCVECQPVAMKKDIGLRCEGHGVYRGETRWNAVDVPHCSGTWELIEGHQPEVCDYSVNHENKHNFIFI